MKDSLVSAQRLLMRAIGTRKLQEGLTTQFDAVRQETAAHGRSLGTRIDALQRSLEEVRAALADLSSQEGGRARALHDRGETLDNDIRGIRASLDRLEAAERSGPEETAPPQVRVKRPAPQCDEGATVLRAKPMDRRGRWRRPRPPKVVSRTFGDLVPLDWRRAIRPFLVFEPWERTSTGAEIVMLVVSALRIDPRVEREARALASAGWSVIVIAPDLSQPPAADQALDWGPSVRFHLLPLATSGYVMTAPWLVSNAMYVAAMGYKPFAYHCHDLTVALIGLRAARDKGARLVCDFHEWYSENVTFNDVSGAWEPHEPRKRLLFRWAERLILKLADRVITVNHSIARELEWLCGRAAGTVDVLRNIPPLNASPTRNYPPLKQQLGLPPDTFVVMYQGGTGPARMLEPVIKALAFAPKVTFVIRGPSLDLFGDHYRAVAREAGVESRLILADPVPSRDVVAAAFGTDVGLWSLPNLSRNFYLALPNKIFEYLAAGLPLLVADFPEAVRIAEGLDVGLAFDPYDPASIAVQMNRFAEDPDFLAARRAAVPVALETLDAGREWDRLCDIYAALRTEPGAPRETPETATA